MLKRHSFFISSDILSLGDRMRKSFKSKKVKTKRWKVVVILLIGIFSFSISLSYLSYFFQKKEVLEFILTSTLFTGNTKTVSKNPSILDFLLDYTIGRQEIEENDLEPKGEYIADPNPKENKKNPIIYIYNTHQTEEYQGGVFMEHDIIPTVLTASYKLREELNKQNINTIVETTPIKDILNANSWNYASSYKASKLLMENAKEKNPTLQYFIDFHRDALPYESSTLTAEGKSYAKVLFVIGTDYDYFERNFELASKLSDKLNELVNGISRGVIKKGGVGVNGIYNQDFSEKTILIEVGGQYNKIGEVNNTVLILTTAIKEIIGG